MVENLQDNARAFRDSVRTAIVLEGDTFRDVVKRCDPFTQELLLTALLGLEGVDCVRAAMQLVPDQFLTEKMRYVRVIAEAVVPIVSQLNDDQFNAIASAVQRSTFYQHDALLRSYYPHLRAISDSSGIAHTAFLTPPVSCCTGLSNLKLSVSTHNKEMGTKAVAGAN